MRATQVTMEISQRDLEWTLNQYMPPEYTVGDLHLTTTGAQATLATPFGRADVLLRVSVAPQDAARLLAESGLARKDIEGAGDAYLMLRIEVQVTKWLSVPKTLVSHVLQKFLGDGVEGVRAEGTVVWVDVPRVLAPVLSAGELHLALADARVIVRGDNVTFVT